MASLNLAKSLTLPSSKSEFLHGFTVTSPNKAVVEPKNNNDEELNTPLNLDLNSLDIHDTVEAMLEEPETSSVIDIVSSDPRYYLHIIENYKKMRDGREVCLTDLFNIIIRRRPNKTLQSIKFKLSDNGTWYEVGYDGDCHTDADVYRAFQRKVKIAINSPRNSHREMLQKTMEEGGREQDGSEDSSKKTKSRSEIKWQGDQNKITKLDKFMGRVSEEPKPEQAQQPEQQPAQQPAQQPEQQPAQQPAPEQQPAPAQQPAPMHQPAPMQQPKKQVTGTEDWTAVLSTCPDQHKQLFTRVVNLITTPDPWTNSIIDKLPTLTPGQRLLVLEALHQATSVCHA